MKHSLRSWLWHVDITQEVDEELAFHIEMRTRELVECGVDERIGREMVMARFGVRVAPRAASSDVMRLVLHSGAS
jgi:hypothetical protein